MKNSETVSKSPGYFQRSYGTIPALKLAHMRRSLGTRSNSLDKEIIITISGSSPKG